MKTTCAVIAMLASLGARAFAAEPETIATLPPDLAAAPVQAGLVQARSLPDRFVALDYIVVVGGKAYVAATSEPIEGYPVQVAWVGSPRPTARGIPDGLFALFGSDDETAPPTLVRSHGGHMTRVTLPPASAWGVPSVPSGEGQPGGRELVVVKGEVWFGRCLDDTWEGKTWCPLMKYARVWPEAKTPPPPRFAVRAPIPAHRPMGEPKGFRLEVVAALPDGADPEYELPQQVVRCTSPDGTRTEIPSGEPGGAQLGWAEWVAHDPPLYAIGEIVPTGPWPQSWRVYEGCKDRLGGTLGLDYLTRVVRGPGRFWLADAGLPDWTLLDAGRIVARGPSSGPFPTLVPSP